MIRRRLAVLAVVGGLACGRGPSETPSPQSLNQTLAQFLDAVKANDLQRMGTLWGDRRGPVVGWMENTQLKKKLTVIQIYLAHDGYRVIDGPLPAPGRDDERTFHVELQRKGCNVAIPIDLVRAKRGSWLVHDVHLESAGNPAVVCGEQAQSGTHR